MQESCGTLLIVDDEEFNRDVLRRRLEIEGFEVAAAVDGAEALKMLAETEYDAVLLDVMMPGQNGYEILSEIRKTHSLMELPVLLVTAKGHTEDMVAAFEQGANDYITKPINFPVALARIKCHLDSRRLASRLRDSEARYALSARGANDGMWDWNLQTDNVHYSSRWKEMLGFTDDEVSDSSTEWLQRIHPEDLPHVQQALRAHRCGQAARFECEYRILHKNEAYIWVLSRGVAVRDDEGREIRMAGSQTDITRGKAADGLTGLANRALFMDHVNQELCRVRPSSTHLFAVLFIDLDRFKVINDSLGHHAGDELLKSIARRLETCIRSSDIVSRLNDRCTIARFGGDEFVILLRGLHRTEDAGLVADRILENVTQPLQLAGQNVAISASIGIAVATSSHSSGDDVLRDADTAMYRAKSAGKSRWCMFVPSMRDEAVKRLALENELRMGIVNNEFVLHFQPIVSLTTSRVEGFEALLRWQHPVRGLLSPMEFIPVAEETGFILELGAWVLDQACRHLRDWQDRYPAGSPYFVSVNVSGRQFSDSSLAARVGECVRRHGIQPQHLKLEITETAIMSNPELAAQTLSRLRAIGVQISLDDFGTGHSSLSYLQQFPIDTLKIDRSFIQRMGNSAEAQEIVRTIVSLAHSLGMAVTAEGIEQRAQHDQLNGLQCETGQGYLYSRPIPANEIELLLFNHCLQEPLCEPTTRNPVPEGSRPTPLVTSR